MQKTSEQSYTYKGMTITDAVELFPEVRENLPGILSALKEEYIDRAEKLNNFRTLCLNLSEKYWAKGQYQDAIRVDGYYYGSMAHKKLRELGLYIARLEDVVTGRKRMLTEDEIFQARTTPLERIVGKERFIHCPFHEERTASLHITKNKWYCHGCSRGGDTVGFVMEKFKLPFRQAVEAINSFRV